MIYILLSLLAAWLLVGNYSLHMQNKKLKAELYCANQNFLDVSRMEDASSLREQENMKLLQWAMAMNRAINTVLEKENKVNKNLSSTLNKVKNIQNNYN